MQNFVFLSHSKLSVNIVPWSLLIMNVNALYFPLYYSVSYHYSNKEHEIRNYVFYLVFLLVGVGSMNPYQTTTTGIQGIA